MGLRGAHGNSPSHAPRVLGTLARGVGIRMVDIALLYDGTVRVLAIMT